ncbi:MAG: GAF domain-containing protein [Actinobacteria bacterium]|nr:GAF domain-containing protein [Actinomycetota bacterium]
METRDATRPLQVELGRLRDDVHDLREELAALRASVHALAALQDILPRMTPGMDVVPLLDDVLASALAVVGATDGSLMLLDEETGELVLAVVQGIGRERLTGYRLPAGRGIAGWVAKNRTAELVRDVQKDPRFYPTVDETFGFQTRMLAAVPLLDGDRVLGVIEAINKTSDREFTAEDNDLLLVVAVLASAAIRRAEALAEEGPAV